MDYFASFWSIQLRKVGKAKAVKAASKINDELWPVIMEGYQRYTKYCKQHRTEKNYILHPSTYLNEKRWEDELELEVESQTESSAYTFVKAVRNKNNLTLPDLPHDIKQTFFRMGIPWGKLQSMHESEIEEKFLQAYNKVEPVKELDYKTLAAGSDA